MRYDREPSTRVTAANDTNYNVLICSPSRYFSKSCGLSFNFAIFVAVIVALSVGISSVRTRPRILGLPVLSHARRDFIFHLLG